MCSIYILNMKLESAPFFTIRLTLGKVAKSFFPQNDNNNDSESSDEYYGDHTTDDIAQW